ncbi:MAG: FAD-dependent oxidoreductase, partial [Candidatus Hydrogenedentota bacterium]
MRFSLLLVAVLVLSGFAAASADEVYDVVVYGGTSGGVTAAVQAARMDQSVILIEPGRHIGGLTSSGLGRTDWGRRGVIGGLSLEFYQRVRNYYDDEDRWVHEDRDDYLGSVHMPEDMDSMWGFEPHAAEAAFRQMLDEEDIPYHIGERLILDPDEGVEKDGERIRAIVMESGKRVLGRTFIDATYEGDLMAMAGVSYIVGREGNEKYDETLNGIQVGNTVNHVFTHEGQRPHPPRPLPPEARVDPYVEEGNPESGLLDWVNPDPGGEFGEGDDLVQAYCYRLCLTDVEENMVPFEPPEGYDEADFELLFRMFEAGEERIPWLPGRMPNRKTDTNNRWAVSMNLVGASHEYPEGDYERRREIEEMHEYWQRGLMYSLANHPRVPEHVREEVSQWGYAADEFEDNDNWPYQIYIRVGRRMVSDYVMTEHDCRHLRVAEDSVGMGSYNMDSHNVQRYVTEHGYVQNEGNIETSPAGPYVISYRSIVPSQGECENLFVPVAVSASHIAFGSVRMEPVFMILGQSAATAAAMANERDLAVQDLPYEPLRERLLADGQYLDPPEVTPQPPEEPIDAEDLAGVVLLAGDAQREGEWEFSSHVGPYVGGGYYHDAGDDAPPASAVFGTELSEGRYEVHIAYSAHDNRATNVPVRIEHADGE